MGTSALAPGRWGESMARLWSSTAFMTSAGWDTVPFNGCVTASMSVCLSVCYTRDALFQVRGQSFNGVKGNTGHSSGD